MSRTTRVIATAGGWSRGKKAVCNQSMVRAAGAKCVPFDSTIQGQKGWSAA